MSFRSAREARERFLQLARRAEESAPLFYRVHEHAGANPARVLTRTQQPEKTNLTPFEFNRRRSDFSPGRWPDCPRFHRIPAQFCQFTFTAAVPLVGTVNT